VGAIIDEHGDVLALGPRQTASEPGAAAGVDDPGRHVSISRLPPNPAFKAHHRVPWIAGGRIDLDNLILLCQWHHTVVHEGGVTITADGEGWLFTKPDGQRCEPWVSDQHLARHLDFALRRQQQQAQTEQLAGVDGFQHPDARTIRPGWAGEPFDLHACAQALFTVKLPQQPLDQDQQAA
jgi:hypothetical protein